MSQIIDGKAVALTIRKEIATEIDQLKKTTPGFEPSLAIIQVGQRPDSSTYVRMERKAAQEAQI